MSILDTIRQTCRRLVGAWTDFWFAPQDPLSLGVLRVLVGSMMVYAHFVWGLNLDGFFGPDGWQSAETVRAFFPEDWLASFWWFVPSDHLRLVHLLCFVPLVMFMLGLFTPWTSVLALVITISNSNRAPIANYGMDQILSLLGLYVVIGGSGAAFSLDAWRERRRRQPQNGDGLAGTKRPRRRTSQARLATRLIQVHLCIIYFFAGISKLQGDAWWNGEAVWMALANQEYQSIDMTWLAHYSWITQLATHSTIYWEISFPFLVWNRTLRPFVLLMGVGIHTGIGLFMGMITFGAIVIFGYMGFVPPAVTQQVIDFAWARRPQSFTRRFPSMDEGTTETPTVVMPQPAFADETVLDMPVPVRPELGRNGSGNHPQVVPTTPAAAHSLWSVAVCDPEWKHREFAHYLSRRNFHPFVCTSPTRLWQHVEKHELKGAVIFIDRLTHDEFGLLLNDLTLSPISELPIVIASQRRRRLRQMQDAELPNAHSLLLPQTFRGIRDALEEALSPKQSPDAMARVIEPLPTASSRRTLKVNHHSPTVAGSPR